MECLVLVDPGAQISTITIEFVKQLGLKIHQLDRILKFETTGGGDIPYMGYVEINLKLPEIKGFNEDVLVIDESAYNQHVPVQLGTLHINKALCLSSKLASLLAVKMAQVGDVPEKISPWIK